MARAMPPVEAAPEQTLADESQGSMPSWIPATDGPVAVPDAAFLYNAEFQRAGPDLKLVGEDGSEFLITGYFAAGSPTLIAPNHTTLDGQTVELLAGPQFPAQYAQAGSAQQAAEAVGKVEKLSGSATVQRADGTTVDLKLGDPIYQSDAIATQDGSSIGVRFSDGTVLSLQDSSRLVINEFVYQPNGADNTALLNVVQGTFSLFAGQVAPTGDMKIQTPIATMGIRGTSILGVDVDAILGRLSLTQDPDGTTGFVEIFNNLNGNLFTILRTVFDKITINENGILALTPKSPQELESDQSLTELLHDFSSQFPQAGPEDRPRPQSGPNRFEPPEGVQQIIFDATPPPTEDSTELLLPADLLEAFIEALLDIDKVREQVLQALQEAPTAGDIILEEEEEEQTTGEGESTEGVLPIDFGSSGPGTVGFESLDGLPVIDGNGVPVTSGGEPLFFSWDAANDVLTAVIPGGEEGEDTPVFSIEVNPTTGDIVVTIIGAADHLGVNDESLSVEMPFTVNAANGQTATGTLTVNIADDVPQATSDVAFVAPGEEQESYNVGLILDLSGSMGGTRLQLMKDAVSQLLNSGNVQSVFITTFASAATHHTAADAAAWFTDIGAAVTTVNGFRAGGGTDYIDALQLFTDQGSPYVPPPLPGGETVFYFLSDGYPNSQVGSDLQADWEAFLQSNGIEKAYAIGIGNGVDTASLNPIAFPNGDDGNPLIVTQENELADTLISTIAGDVSGNVLTDQGGADDFGADGQGGIQSIEIDGVVYTYNPVTGDIEFSGQDGQDLGDGNLMVYTDLGGEFSFSFIDGADGQKAGEWKYTPFDGGEPYELDYDGYYLEAISFPGQEFDVLPFGPSLPYENLRYTIFDGDGDTSTASLTIVTDADRVDNVVQGESDDSILEGAAEDADVLVGGLGGDVFVLNGSVVDFIADYSIGEGDQIDLSALLDGVSTGDAGDFVRLDERGEGAVDALQINTGSAEAPNFVDVALLNGDAGVNIIIDDAGGTANIQNGAIT